MNGLIQAIGTIILKHQLKDSLLIVGYGSIGHKYHQAAKSFFNKGNIYIYSKHSNKKIDLKLFKNKEKLNYIILSNPATERIKFFKSFIKKKATYIFEKPLNNVALNVIDKNFLINSINKNQIKIKSGYCLRLNPAVQNFRKKISNNLNNIIDIKINTSSYLPSWRKRDYRDTVSAKKKYGGGVLNELSHEIDLVLYLFGKPKFVFGNYFNSKSLQIDVEDIANIIFYMKKDLNLNMHLDFCTPFQKREIEVIFKNKRKIVLDLIKNEITEIYNNKIKKKKFLITKYFYIKKQIEKMIEISYSKKNNKWKSELNDSIKVLDIIKKIRESKLKNKLIKI